MKTSTKVLIIISSVCGGFLTLMVIASFLFVVFFTDLLSDGSKLQVVEAPAQQSVVSSQPVSSYTPPATNNTASYYVPSIPNTTVSYVVPSTPSYQETYNNAIGNVGYVTLKNEKSWLNLRTGPGTNYDFVYLIPGDKKSIVKQAHGDTVTILETVSTGDKKNPIWYRVQINYGGQIVTGYSSANYITLY